MSSLKKYMKKQLKKAAVAGLKRVVQAGPGRALGTLAGPEGALVGAMVDKAVKKRLNRGAYTQGRGSYTAGRGNYTTGRGQYTQGRGAYDAPFGVQLNGLHTGSVNSNVATIKQAKGENGQILFSKREFITSVNSAGNNGWTNMSFSVNPGLASVFPFLSQIATNFQEYELISARFIYEPVVSPMSVSDVGSLGSVVISANYNAGAQKFSTFAEAVESSQAIRGTIATPLVFGMECDPSQGTARSRYIRGGAVPTGQDIKTYDHALLQVGLFGVPSAYIAGTQLGLLWVEYTVELSKPLLYDALGKAIPTDYFATDDSTTANWLNGGLMDPDNSIGGVVTNPSTGVVRYTFPDNFSGTVGMIWEIYGTGLSYTQPTFASSVLPFNAYMDAGVDTYIIYDGGSGNTTVQLAFTINVATVAGQNYVNFTQSSFTAATTASLRVFEINPSIGSLAATGIPIPF